MEIQLLIKQTAKDETVYYEDEKSFGIYCEKGLDMEKTMQAIKKMDI